MCCDTNVKHSAKHGKNASCGCKSAACSGPMFWSKKKRIRMVEHSIECLQSQIDDLKELLQELQTEN